jgi:hypothetical protein
MATAIMISTRVKARFRRKRLVDKDSGNYSSGRANISNIDTRRPMSRRAL